MIARVRSFYSHGCIPDSPRSSGLPRAGQQSIIVGENILGDVHYEALLFCAARDGRSHSGPAVTAHTKIVYFKGPYVYYTAEGVSHDSRLSNPHRVS